MSLLRQRRQSRRRRDRKIVSTLGASVALLAVTVLGVPLMSAPPAQARPPSATGHNSSAGQFRIQVRRISPPAPQISLDERPFAVVLALTNLTGQPLTDVTITGTRGDPIANRDALDTALHKPFPSTGYPIQTNHPVTVDVPADGLPHDVVFSTTTGIPTDSGICLCHNAVYPLSFTATDTADSGTDTGPQELGTTGTYLPAFKAKPQAARVSWVWPLIDRPHRLADDRNFTDDDLASSVSFDGRLDRSLSVLERVAPSVPVTVVVDPELIDELQIMTTGKYTVQSGRHRVAGKGAAAARAWLERLRALLQDHPDVRLEATPYGDPDVQSLSMNDLSWRAAMPAAMTQRVRLALGGRSLDDDLVWPARGRLGSHTLVKLAKAGIREAVLATASVTPADGADGSVPVGTARLSRAGHRIGVGLTDPDTQNYVASVVTRGHPGLAQLPQLMSEIAVRVAQEPTVSHSLVLTPPRYVDADPAVAARAILDTSKSPFTSPTALSDLLAPDALPTHLSHLTKVRSSVPTLPDQVVAWAHHVTSTLPTVESLLGGVGDQGRFRISTAATTAISAMSTALQRVESSFWISDPQGGTQFADELANQVDAIVNGVQIVRPKSGTYTLASGNSPLPITVANNLAYPVFVRLKVTTVNGLTGFTARDIGAQQIDPHGQRTLHLPTTIARSGRIQIQAQLLTPTAQPLGQAVPLSVHSSAFGVVGVVITIVAGAVLLLALLVRALRWLYRRRRAAREPGTDQGPNPGAPNRSDAEEPGEMLPATPAPTWSGQGP